jgi:plasmid stabilization system protein ParE
VPSGFEVVRSAQCDLDLELIFDHLFAAYRELGDPVPDAFGRAERRLRGIEDEIERLGDVPYQGTLDPKIMDGLRHVTKSGAVFYFIIDDAERCLRVLGVFFGGQDHRAHILTRIAGSYPPETA